MEEFDYIVIGAGSAGSVVAARLTEDASVSVLLLEAGAKDHHPLVHIPAGFPQLFQSSLDWNFRTTPQPTVSDRAIYWPRGKVLGGSSAINAMMWVRGMRADYDRWAELAGPRWSYDAVLPYFCRIESTEGEETDSTTRGVDGPLAVSKQRDPNPLTKAWISAAEAYGLPLNARPNSELDDGVGLAMVNQKNGRRMSSADAYLRPARHRTNLTIKTKAECSRITIENGIATGIVYRHHGQDVVAAARREVVSCAGAIGSPVLLMRSGIGPGQMLQVHGIGVISDREQVGKRLQDHLTGGVVFSAKGKNKTLAKAQTPSAVAKYFSGKKGLLTSNIAEGYAFVRSSPALTAPDLELLFVPGPFLDEGLTLSKKNGITVGAVLLQPKSHGEIRLSNAASGFDIDPRYLSDPQGNDVAVLSSGVRTSLAILQQSAISKYVGQPIQPAVTDLEPLIDAAVHGVAQTLYHPVGTCAMGMNDQDVVDPQLCVRGVQRLRVVDASVIPQIIRGHTHAPAVLIGEIAADLIRSAQKTSPHN